MSGFKGKRILLVLVVALVFSGCIVQGTSPAFLAVVITVDDDVSVRVSKTRADNWISTYNAALGVWVEADDMEPVAATSESTQADVPNLSVELTVDAGKGRRVSAFFVRLVDGGLRAYANADPESVDMADGQTAEINLATTRIESAGLTTTIQAETELSALGFIDLASGLRLPSIPCEKNVITEAWTCDYPDVPTGRALLPVATAADGQEKRFESKAVTLTADGEDHQLALFWEDGQF